MEERHEITTLLTFALIFHDELSHGGGSYLEGTVEGGYRERGLLSSHRDDALAVVAGARLRRLGGSFLGREALGD